MKRESFDAGKTEARSAHARTRIEDALQAVKEMDRIVENFVTDKRDLVIHRTERSLHV